MKIILGIMAGIYFICFLAGLNQTMTINPMMALTTGLAFFFAALNLKEK